MATTAALIEWAGMGDYAEIYRISGSFPAGPERTRSGGFQLPPDSAFYHGLVREAGGVPEWRWRWISSR